MRKMLKNSAFILALLVSVPAIFGASKPRQAYATTIEGDLYGGARIRCVTKAGSDTGYVTELNVGGAGNGNFAGTGVYIRIKNNTTTDTPITMKFNSTNGAGFGPATGVNQTYYDVNGVETTGIAARGWGNYLMLPANFNGFIYMNYTTQMSRIFGTADFDPDHMWRVYIEYSGFYDSYADFVIGDIFTDSRKVLDGSELDSSAFAATWINQTGAVQEITQLPRSDSFVPDGDFEGGLHASLDGYGGFMIKSSSLLDLSDSAFFIRIKNNQNVVKYPMIHVASDWFAYRVVTNEGQVIEKYDASGAYDGSTTVNAAGYFELPANFNGYLKVNWNGFKNDWGDEFSNTKVNAIYYESEGFDVNIGDIFTQLQSFFDGSERYASEFSTWTETWSGATLELLEGSKPVPVVLFDYTQITYTVGLERGVNVTAKKNPDNTVFSTATISFTNNLDLSAGEAVAISMKGNGSFAFGLEFYDSANNALMMPAPGDAAAKPIYFIKEGVASAMNHTTGDPNTIHEIIGEGTLVAEKAFLAQKAGDSFDWAHVAAIKVRVHTFYDNGINIVLGDIGTADQTGLSYTCVFDVSELLNWSTYFHADDEFIVVKQYSIPKASEWIGDVKIIDSLNYRDDEEMNAAISYDDDNNPCSYHRQDDGLFVHNGPYEVDGHAYGSYMCLPMFDHGVTTDRKQAYKMVGEEKVYGKGLTFYAKNLSNKDIGVTLQFDEKIPGKTYTERWCIVGYPALYYAWDVKTNAEYMFYSKSDQVQIPVGFEGYIRVPFESYSVPEWNKGQEGVDEILDLDNFTGDFFFTSDNARYEDLEFFIKNIGMYFNETRKGNMFDNSNTIKANMGL